MNHSIRIEGATASGVPESHPITGATVSGTVSQPSPPQLVSSPVITGTAIIGGRLNCTPGGWDNQPDNFTFQWQRDGSINIATGDNYVVTALDLNHELTCNVTAKNWSGYITARSNAVTINGQAELITRPA
jgi:hypothetical protein